MSSLRKCDLPICGVVSGLLLVTGAGEDGEAGVLGVAGIGDGKFAEKEYGAVGRFDAARMKTIGAESSTHRATRLLLRTRHEHKDSAVCRRSDC